MGFSGENLTDGGFWKKVNTAFFTKKSGSLGSICIIYEIFVKIGIFRLIFQKVWHTIEKQSNCEDSAVFLMETRGEGPLLNVVLVEPEIPQNCGNIARTCAATGARLHLIRPLGFDISEKAVRRAGLDYWHMVEVIDYENLEDFFSKNEVRQMWCLSTKAPRCYTEARFEDGCYLFFGKETKGLPESFLEEHRDRCVRLPMREDARSLNLSNSVAVTVYEALRQLEFPGLLDHGKMKGL